ncbi:MAG: phosphatase [Planctomycetota bacterium]|nr:phosphatase [Planctomycetota bacterium]MDP6762713.1 phosphatase [Planctomycetota bacterium]MDP6988561.1 phosphatase [Planctomycetota bacterium]
MSPLTAQLGDEQRATLARARLLVLDVDGTLTDGKVVYTAEHEEQRFCIRDGQGLAWLRAEGLVSAWITGRGCEATRRRAADCGVEHLFTRCGPKGPVLERLQAELGITPAETVAMGDDLPDLALAERAAFFAVPADAREALRERADLVCAARGGDGAVRELAEHILRARGRWAAILEASR